MIYTSSSQPPLDESYSNRAESFPEQQQQYYLELKRTTNSPKNNLQNKVHRSNQLDYQRISQQQQTDSTHSAL